MKKAHSWLGYALFVISLRHYCLGVGDIHPTPLFFLSPFYLLPLPPLPSVLCGFNTCIQVSIGKLLIVTIFSIYTRLVCRTGGGILLLK